MNPLKELLEKTPEEFEKKFPSGKLSDGYNTGIPTANQDEIKSFIKEAQLDTVKAVMEEMERVFQQGHGGGNWRRLYIQFYSSLKEIIE